MHNCKRCDKKFKTKGNLKRHMQYKHDTDVKWYNCTECDTRSKTNSDLKRHMANVHDINVTWYHCKSCKYKSKRLGHLKSHMSNIHDIDVKWYNCTLCEYKSKENGHLKKHTQNRHNIGVIWKRCDICDYKCKQNNQLKRHLSLVHDIGDLECKICLKMVYSLTSLTDGQGTYKMCRKCYNKITGKDSRVETIMSKYLDSKFGTEYLIASDNRIYGDKCQSYRPDKLYASPDRIIHIECDEQQHKGRYEYSCEEKRISEIYDEFCGKNYIIIRWNPDNYIPVVGMKLTRKERLQLLLDVMKFARTMIVPNKIIVIYMHYDYDNSVICKIMQKIFISMQKQLKLEQRLNYILYKELTNTGIISHEFRTSVSRVCGKLKDNKLHLVFPHNKPISFIEIFKILIEYWNHIGQPRDINIEDEAIKLKNIVETHFK